MKWLILKNLKDLNGVMAFNLDHVDFLTIENNQLSISLAGMDLAFQFEISKEPFVDREAECLIYRILGLPQKIVDLQEQIRMTMELSKKNGWGRQ